ncbi:glutamate-gated chloride channel isoform X10 [Plutella xylostella]|uniref:glutamate-gated chloride channel isoform X10 n=1 Tax=Plutella xylostella TaxID=51655 RepID=UPI0018D143B7|nr:glutamate-gated chloride channel isoform X10 [Plutella xylostella]
MGWSTAAARALPLLMLGCVSVSALTSDIFAAGKSDKEILDNLLKNSRYDKRLLPPVDDPDFCCGLTSPNDSLAQNRVGLSSLRPRSHNRGVLTVNVSVLLLSLASPDESSLKYEVEFLLQQQWYDPRLRYSNQSHYDFLNAIHHHEDIWLPDTYFIMHGDFKEFSQHSWDPIIPMHFALRIYRNGTINYLMRRHLILSCQGRLNIFPFDDPLCSFALESISYESSAITYVWKNDEDTLRKSPSLTTLNAYLIQNQTIPCPIKASWRAEGYSLYEEDEELTCNLCQRRFEEQGNYSCLKVDLIFTRDRAFYFTTVFIPGIILVTSSFITFWLEWNAVPARSMIGVTTMLNFFTTSNGFRSTLPVVSNLTAMNVWDGVCMCFIYASLLEFVCVNYVGRKRPLHNVVYRPGENPVTQRLPAVLSRIGIILASPLEAMALYHWATSETETPQPETSGAADKKRDSTGAAELVNCAACSAGPPGACTHTTNNGGVTEPCFVQVRKKEPPHPIRVAKTIDVIARITFPTAYAVFLIFFFIHYKAFS